MKITIVGGGTAGWIAAYFISKSQSKLHEISVVESSKIGIIGAGEGSTGSMMDLLSGGFFDYKIDIKTFMEETDSTPKMGIKHINWSKNKDQYFAPLDVSPSAFSLDDYIFKYVLSEYGKEKMHLSSQIGIHYENNKYENVYAFHFDGHKVGNFFKKECEKDDVKIFDAVVKDCILDNNGDIKSIVLDDGFVIESDLFIDCTGFSKILMKSVGAKWISKKDVLPMDTAMPFLIQYKQDEVFIPETKSLALSSGWMWDIPLATRRGCGYVFSKDFLSVDEAKLEIEKNLGFEIEPIKIINFDSGYSSHFWKNNVLCLGLSSSFVEPLEATSIHNTIVQTAIFVNEFLHETKEKTMLEINKNLYNKRITFLNELTVDFISLHYQGGRSDTKFWEYIKKEEVVTDNAKNIIEYAKNFIPSYVLMEGMYGSFSIPLANWNLAGMGIINKKIAKEELVKNNKMNFSKKQYENFIKSLII